MKFEFQDELNFLPFKKNKPSKWERFNKWMSESNPEGVTGWDCLFMTLFPIVMFSACIGLVVLISWLFGIHPISFL